MTRNFLETRSTVLLLGGSFRAYLAYVSCLKKRPAAPPEPLAVCVRACVEGVGRCFCVCVLNVNSKSFACSNNHSTYVTPCALPPDKKRSATCTRPTRANCCMCCSTAARCAIGTADMKKQHATPMVMRTARKNRMRRPGDTWRSSCSPTNALGIVV